MSRIIFGRKVAEYIVLMTISLFSIAILSACSPKGDTGKAQSGQVTATGKAAIGGAYTLVDQTGKTVTDVDFHGRPLLIYFGYAYCPDVCPTALQQMGAALELAGKAADYYQPIFITIDPERDTPEKLAQYVTAPGFPKGLIGLGGSAQQIDRVKEAFKVYGKKAEDPDSADGYTYDHSSMMYLMDENGEFIDVFSHSNTPQEIADRLIAYKKTGR